MGSYLLSKAKSSFSKEQITKIGMYAIGQGGGARSTISSIAKQ